MTAGDIMVVSENIDAAGATTKNTVLTCRYRDIVRRVLLAQGATPQTLQQLDSLPQNAECDCPTCKPQPQT